MSLPLEHWRFVHNLCTTLSATSKECLFGLLAECLQHCIFILVWYIMSESGTLAMYSFVNCCNTNDLCTSTNLLACLLHFRILHLLCDFFSPTGMFLMSFSKPTSVCCYALQIVLPKFVILGFINKRLCEHWEYYIVYCKCILLKILHIVILPWNKDNDIKLYKTTVRLEHKVA